MWGWDTFKTGCRSDVPAGATCLSRAGQHLPGSLTDQRRGPDVREQMSGREVRLRQMAFLCRDFGPMDLTEAVTSFLMITMSRSKRALCPSCPREPFLSVRHLHALSPLGGSDRRNCRPLMTSLVSDRAESHRSPPLKPHGRASSRTGGTGHIPSGSRVGLPSSALWVKPTEPHTTLSAYAGPVTRRARAGYMTSTRQASR